MKPKHSLRISVLLLSLLMLSFLFAGCQETSQNKTTPLVVGISTLSAKFSPFFADTAYDMEVVEHTQANLLTTDRTGAVVYNAIKGETIPYGGVDYTYKGIADVKVDYDEAANKTTYLWTIRNDVRFSDGKKMDADDVIFSYYVFADPTYTGSTTLYSVNIDGLRNYRTQTSDEVYEKYSDMADVIYAAGPDHSWSSSDSWTKEQQDSYWAILKQEWIDDVQAIVDYVVNNYMGYAKDYTGFEAAQINEEEGLKVMLGMVLWGFGEVGEDGVLTSAYNNKTWTLKDGDYPTVEDFYEECVTAYEGDPEAYWGKEAADDDSVVDAARSTFISTEGPKDPSLGGKGIPNIAGIKKLSNTQVEITVNGFDATAIYSLGIPVVPLHYYGDESKYDYKNNKFGFDFGDLSGVEAKTSAPMGAGPYRFIKYENKVVYYEANEYYYKGAPKTYYMQYKETLDEDKISGIASGAIDITDPSFGTAAVEEICSYNSNGETSGDVIRTNTVDNLGYGYVGINATTVNVGGVSDSQESKNLRRALATLIAVYRDLTVDSYYGERASVINYPISNTSWAAPQKTDDGYRVAFSAAVDGSDIYTSEMNADAKYDAALEAAIGYFKAAGYTFDEASGKFTAAPEGAKLSYEIIVPGDGAGDHPSFMLCTKVKEALEKIGIELIINDPSDSNVLWDKLDAGEQELWCAAWDASIDPDMYQVYHSSNIVGLPGSSESNHYHIQDAELDKLIMEARKSDDQAFRKATYKACLDIIIDWAVEIPIYQRQNCIIFSAERVKLDTVTPDITTFWNWYKDIEKLEMVVDTTQA
ncbi:MAG: ABC transporter substrate-binding protein [Christensenellales bacterium]|jgi:peptide/nickel transport system substrate-binding protein